MITAISRISSLASSRRLAVSVLAGLLVCAVLALAPQPVIIKVDGQPLPHKTLHRTVGAVLAEAGVELGPNDAVQPDLSTSVARGTVIAVNRAVSVEVNVDGKSVLVHTPKVSVIEALQAAGIGLGPLDQVSIPLDSMVAEGTTIGIKRVAEQVVTEHYQLPVPMERTDDPNMERGRSRVVRTGAPGEAQRLVKVTFVDGRQTGRVLLKDEVLRSPVSKLVAYGTVSEASRGGETFRFRAAMDVVSTAYSFENGRYTATGQLVRFGVVAVDPRVIPLGTRLYVEGYGYGIAADKGSAIKGNRIDVFLESSQDAHRWGRRQTRVYILE
jgi:uncharacterized protein YabE (DUF348 family)